jgi:hypothetical protein
MKKAVKEIQKVGEEIQRTITILIMASFAFVSVLAWNEAVKSLFEAIFPDKGNLGLKFLYAIIITIITIIISKRLKIISKKSS